MTSKQIERFWRHVDRSTATACWLWSGKRGTGGYGHFYANGHHLAHRVAYELSRGPIPAGRQLDHLCKNPSCVNPEHLEPVTGYENIMRSNCLQALNARKTHCKNGHPFDDHNTWRGKEKNNRTTGKRRSCKECNKVNMRRLRERRKKQPYSVPVPAQNGASA